MSLQILVFLLLVVVAAVALPLLIFLRPERTKRTEDNQLPPAFRPRWSASPEVLAQLRRFYVGRACAVCQGPIGAIHGEPRPGLFNVATRQCIGWEDIQPDQIPVALETHLPVCEHCHTAESFRHQFPNRFVDREPTPYRDSAVH